MLFNPMTSEQFLGSTFLITVANFLLQYEILQLTYHNIIYHIRSQLNNQYVRSF